MPFGLPGWAIAVLAVALVIVIIIVAILGRFFKLWIQAYVSQAKVSLSSLIGMWLRKVDMNVIVFSRIRAVKARLNITTDDLETHYLAGGRVPNVISAMIAASNAKIELPWGVATAIDLAGRDILDAVNTSVNPKVIDCPGPNQ
ncbi:MAG: flotillin-like FloA family protein, partial [Phycisphaerales bacterium]|nr:flotillin-like FloA family protein [Phycisphaerales bacterium]